MWYGYYQKKKKSLYYFMLYLTLLMIIVLGIFIDNYFTKNKGLPSFVVKKIGNSSSVISSPIFESYLISEPNFLLAAHSATLEVLPNDQLLALWFAGSHEGRPDVNIWQSKYINGHWNYAKSAVSPQSLTEFSGFYVRKVGNPVVYRQQNGVLHLFVVSVGLIGGWSGSGINHLISKDNGASWHFKEKLILSPFFDISTLIRTSAVDLQDGGFYLPVYHEVIRKYPELLRFDHNGSFTNQIRVSSNNYHLQPAVLVLSKNKAYIYMRNGHELGNQSIYMQSSKDAGLHWSEPIPTNIANDDSSLMVANLGEHLFLMVHNVGQRNKLALAISHDGIAWTDVYYLENGDIGLEYSYPAIKVHDDIVDILYTWQRKKIKHVRFNLAWLNNIINEGGVHNGI